MSMERREAKLNDMGVGPDSDVLYIVRSATYTSDTLEVFEQVVRIDTDAVDGTFSLAMPPVSLAKGKIYCITLYDDGGDVTITDNAGDTAGLTGGALDDQDITLDADDEYTVLLSDGFQWFEIGSNHS